MMPTLFGLGMVALPTLLACSASSMSVRCTIRLSSLMVRLLLWMLTGQISVCLLTLFGRTLCRCLCRMRSFMVSTRRLDGIIEIVSEVGMTIDGGHSQLEHVFILVNVRGCLCL